MPPKSSMPIASCFHSPNGDGVVRRGAKVESCTKGLFRGLVPARLSERRKYTASDCSERERRIRTLSGRRESSSNLKCTVVPSTKKRDSRFVPPSAHVAHAAASPHLGEERHGHEDEALERDGAPEERQTVVLDESDSERCFRQQADSGRMQ